MPIKRNHPAAAIVVGAYGQDGNLLARDLENANIQVIMVGRGDCDLTDLEEVGRLFQAGPGRHDVYFLAAIHKSSETKQSLDQDAEWKSSMDLHATAPAVFLEVMKRRNGVDRFFYASSSRIFGIPTESPQTENTPRSPKCIYGITKVAGMEVCDFFRRNYGLFACTGILYNHESPLRKLPFLSKKVVRAAVASRHDASLKCVIQNLSSQVDWSYAGDIVQAMQYAINHVEPRDFVMSSGRTHSVKDFVRLAYDEANLNWADHVEFQTTEEIPENQRLVGDNSLLKKLTGWKPSLNFEEMVRMLVRAESNV